MLRGKIKVAVSWILLIYFALVIVPPVSSFAILSQSNAAASEEVNLEQHQSTTLLLFDIMLWQQLKKAKHSQHFLTEGTSVDSVLQIFEEQVIRMAVFALLLSGFPLLFVQFAVPLSERLRSSLIHFSRSGVSPPAFS